MNEHVDTSELSWDEWDELHDPRPQETQFDAVVERAVSRRGFLGGILALGSAAVAMTPASLLSSTSAYAQAAASRFAFTPVPIATDSTVHVPQGYSWKPLVKWGDPLFSDVPEFDQETAGSPMDSARRFGENTDGMESFLVGDHEIIAVNHEYVNPKINLPQAVDGVPTSADDVIKLQNLQGVAVMEIRETDDAWQVVKDSPFNRRITHNTPIKISGPAAGHELLQTPADPTGTLALGTLNNCGSGKTPWGTYLTCEENFNGYFGSTDAAFERTPEMSRYGVNMEGRYAYEKFDERFDISKSPNEPNRHGWIVEIDPTNPDAMPVKRTALGRFKHENAAATVARDGRVVVYMGDDERGEFLYKYVSNGVYVPGGDTSTLLDDGQLFVARFEDDASGQWVALTPELTGMSAEEILIYSRVAASRVNATTMDRPEWVAVNPTAVEGYCCLTNNSRRGVRANAGGDWTPVTGPNPRAENKFGQIVRWYPQDDDHTSDSFTWDLFVMAGNPVVKEGAYAGSSNINEGNMFNSPDGMVFDSTGIVWIQTDGNDSNEGDFAGMGNNQMLAGDPATGRIERFLTGPLGSEVTGLCWSADKRTMFVGIQHPDSPFPDGEGTLARSAIVAIKRDDSALIG